ncbi:DUF397 domain-containing protein [Sphaerisporangium sp. NPDC005288]|uniref:DUF397 domain-containing protein n=1 Tax=Sphaerisporangium sp. NPDC005288 TaxID=3155114 RepID=UPI0033BEBC79
MEHTFLSRADRPHADGRKSTYSGGTGGGCVEVVRNLPGVIAVRDGKVSGGSVPLFSAGEWSALLAGVGNGDLGRAVPGSEERPIGARESIGRGASRHRADNSREQPRSVS